MEFNITPIKEKDINEIYELGIHDKDFSADGGENCFWPKDTLLRIINSKSDVALKLTVNNKIVGYSLSMIHPTTKKAVLENIHTIKEYRYLAHKLLKETENKIIEKGAQFIAYLYDLEDDSNEQSLFEENDFFEGNKHIWYHKNISFSSTAPNKEE